MRLNCTCNTEFSLPMTASVFLILIFVILLPGSLHSQSALDLEARKAYQAAVVSHDKGDFKSAAAGLLEAIRLLGKTNIRIQPVLVRSLFGMGDYPSARKEIEVYFALSPDPALAEYAEMESLRKQTAEAIKRDDADFETACKAGDEKSVKAYLSVYPYGLHATEAFLLLDENAWAAAESSGKHSGYVSYQAAFPNGIHKSDCLQELERTDEVAWDAALRTNSLSSYRAYLAECPRGTHAAEASSRTGVFLDDDAFAKASRANTKDAFVLYMKSYPRGRHAVEAKAKYDVFIKEENRIAAEKAAAASERRAKERKAQHDSYASKAAGHYFMGGLMLTAGIGGGALAFWQIMRLSEDEADSDNVVLSYLLIGVGAGLAMGGVAYGPKEFEKGDSDRRHAAGYAAAEPPRFIAGLIPVIKGGAPGIELALRLEY